MTAFKCINRIYRIGTPAQWYSELVSRSDLTYDGMIDFGPYGMPVANGRFGEPVWEKDAKYKLLAKGGFLVSSSMVDGKIGYVEIESQLGGECQIRNPWDSKVDIYRNGVKSETFKSKENSLLKFDTEAGERIVLVPKGADITLEDQKMRQLSLYGAFRRGCAVKPQTDVGWQS